MRRIRKRYGVPLVSALLPEYRKSMKFVVSAKILLGLSALLVLSSCSLFNDPYVDSTYNTFYILPTGASMILDAYDFSGNSTNPASACAVTTWADKSGNGNNGTLTCGTGGFTGAGNQASPFAVNFDGANTGVTTSLNVQAAAMPNSTWIAWVNPSNTSLQHIMSADNHAGAFNRSLVINSGSFEAFTGTATNFTGTTIDQSQWQQIAVVYTPTDIIIYKNAAPFARGTAPTIQATAQTFTIGRSAGGAFDFFSGAINWVAVYPRALTAVEISVACKAVQLRFNLSSCN